MGVETSVERIGIEVVATGVSEAEYMERYVGAGHEWENGEVIKLAPVTLKHFKVVQYSENLLEIYFALRPIGMVLGEPYVLKISPSSARREPDLMLILKTNPGQLTETAFLGPADICIEVVSEGSEEHDYGKKLSSISGEASKNTGFSIRCGRSIAFTDWMKLASIVSNLSMQMTTIRRHCCPA
jgi:Putative restriction endonuclease